MVLVPIIAIDVLNNMLKNFKPIGRIVFSGSSTQIKMMTFEKNALKIFF